MNRLIISFVAVFAVSPAFAADAKPEPGYITGRVVGPDGKPLPGAAVGYYDASRTTVTGADGRFKLGPIPPTAKPHRGVYANAEGLAREYVQAPPVLPGVSSDLGDIVLLLGRRYNGRVTDDKGTPLPGVRVRCELLRKSNRYTSFQIGPEVEGLTNADGKYDLPPLPIGTHSLRFEFEGRATIYSNLLVEPGPTTEAIPVRMEKEIPLRGRVIDEDGKPIAGAVIARREQNVKTGADGKFVVHGLGEQSKFLKLPVEAAGFISGEVGAAGGDDVEVKLLRHGWFAGRAVDANTGKSVRLDSARISSVPRNPKAPAGAVTSSSAATLEQPETGRFRIQFDAPASTR